MDPEDEAILDDEPSCVGRAVDITGHDVAAWVIPSISWRGRPLFRPKLERYFVHWSTEWSGRRRRTFDEAKNAALAVLWRVDKNGGRRDRA